MQATERGEPAWIERLHAEREPRHPRRAKAGEMAGAERAGVRLQCHFRAGQNGKRVVNRREDARDLRGPQERGRAAAEEDRRDGRIRRVPAAPSRISAQSASTYAGAVCSIPSTTAKSQYGQCFWQNGMWT